MSPKRFYNEKEISAVLKRAAELQRGQGPGNTSGLSLDELEQIAAEAGIDPAFVKTAAEELEETPPDETYHVLGAPTSVDLERIVDGEMTEEKWGEVVAEIRRVYGVVGEVGQVGQQREWSYRDQTGERMHVTATPTRGQTRIRLSMRMADWAIAVHAPIMSTGIAFTILEFILLHWGPIIETGLAIFIFAALHMVSRLAFGALARSQERKGRKLLNRIEACFAEPVTPLAEPVKQVDADEANRIDAALLSDDVAPKDASSIRRRDRE